MIFNQVTQWLNIGPDFLWTVLYAMWLIGTTVFILSRPRRPVTSLAWLLAFWTLPIVSALAYFLFGPRRYDDQNHIRRLLQSELPAHAPSPDETIQDEFFEASNLADVAHVTRHSGESGPPPYRADAIELYESGDEAYPAIEAAIDEAQSTVHIEYYIWMPDTTGTRLRDRLVACARRGVHVRLVLDSIGAMDCRESFWAPLIEAGGEIRKFNPPRLFKPQPGKINFRTHRKIVVVDGRIGFSGGINVSDQNRSDEDGDAWRNTHLRVTGRPAQVLQRVLLVDWLYSLDLSQAKIRLTDILELFRNTRPELPQDLDNWFPALKDACGPWVQIVDSGPDEPTNDAYRLYFAAITSARRRIWITTPYFVPDEGLETALKIAASRGVDVRVLLPSVNDSLLVGIACKTYAMDVMADGVQVSLYKPGMNHSKTMVVDDDFSIVGTANLDNRSLRLNFEVVAAVFDADFADSVAALFEKHLAKSEPFCPEKQSERWHRRLYHNASRLLSPLL